MGREEAEAPMEAGGLQVPNIRHELLLLSVRTLQHWTRPVTAVGAAVGTALLRAALPMTAMGPRVIPGRGGAVRISLRGTLAQSGLTVLRHALACPTLAAELATSRLARARAGAGSSATHIWEDGWLRRDYTHQLQSLHATHHYQETHLGTMNAHGVFLSSVLDSGLLYLGSGERLRLRHLPGLDVAGKTVGEVLRFERVSASVARFRYKLSDTLAPEAARSFRLLCDLLLFSYPALLLLRSDGPLALRARPDADVEWYLRPSGRGVCLAMNRGPGDENLGPVASREEATRLARRSLPGRRIHFDPHPLLSSVIPIWSTQQLPKGRALRAVVAAEAWARSKQATLDRTATLAAQHEDIAAALGEISWNEIHRMPFTSSRQRLCAYKVKSGRINDYSKALGKFGCPHCPQLGSSGGRLGHILWTCPQAQRLWLNVREQWGALGAWTARDAATEAAFLRAVFSIKLLAVPAKAWDLPSLERLASRHAQDSPDIFPTLRMAWQHQVTTTFLTLAQWRQGVHDETRAWTAAQAQAVHRAALRNAIRQLRHALETTEAPTHPGVALLADLLEAADCDAVAPLAEPAGPRPRYLLFFDGGSRGNPGPGGAGAVIVATDASASAASIVWSASISLARPDTTNNHAEYRGVVAGLRAALDQRLMPLEVIGDSALILGQLQHYRSPRNAKLVPLYATARRMADRLGVTVWLHHLRRYNKMADHVANVAMDRRYSIQVFHPATRVEHSGLHSLLPGDFGHWQELAGCRPVQSGTVS